MLLERDIISHWLYDDQIYISVLCITFNHGRLIERAVESFLNQKCTYRFEIIIHDDCSDDNTRTYLRAIAENYPNIIKVLLPCKNQYSINKSQPAFNCLGAAKGEFLAFCEGDDYWLDERKLNKQISALLDNENINMSVHDTLALNYDLSESQYEFVKYSEVESILPYKFIAEHEMQFASTSSTFIRRSGISDLPKDFNSAPCMDIFFEILAGRNGIYYFPDLMSCYTLNVPGSFSESNKNSSYKLKKYLLEVILYFDKLKTILSQDDWNSIVRKRSFFYQRLCITEATDNGKRSLIFKYWLMSLVKRKINLKDVGIVLNLLGVSIEIINKLRHKFIRQN